MRRILNFGSMNIDNVYTVEHFVRPGETISSLEMEVFPGGKGLNQTVALARAGAEVYHAGKIGKDFCWIFCDQLAPIYRLLKRSTAIPEKPLFR